MLPAIIAGAATSLLGDAFGAWMDSKENAKQRAMEQQMASNNTDLQREFAQNSIQWKVQDAIHAGLHPLAALGAQGTSYSPQQVGDQRDNSWGNFARSTGQNISRAISAVQSSDQRAMSQMQMESMRLDLEGKTIDNQIRASQLATMSGAQVGPAAPKIGSDGNFMPGQQSIPLVEEQPLKRTISQTGRAAQEAGWRPDVSYARTDTGLTPMVPESLSESLEDDIIGKAMWRWRNQVLPNVTGQGKPAMSQLPKGYSDWDYDGSAQEWRPVKNKGSYPYERFKNSKIGKFFSDWKY